MTHTVTGHEPESITLHYGENNCGRKWVVATEGEKGTKKKKRHQRQSSIWKRIKIRDT